MMPLKTSMRHVGQRMVPNDETKEDINKKKYRRLKYLYLYSHPKYDLYANALSVVVELPW